MEQAERGDVPRERDHRVGDIIVRVNEARTRKEVAKMLNQPELEWILVIARLEVFQ